MPGSPLGTGELKPPMEGTAMGDSDTGNRDDAKFNCPNQFEAQRRNAGHHLAFGIGIHRCVGQALARLELKIIVQQVVRRMRGLTLAVPEADLRYTPNIASRNLVSLPVRFTRPEVSV